jgi:hypothetical protein
MRPRPFRFPHRLALLLLPVLACMASAAQARDEYILDKYYSGGRHQLATPALSRALLSEPVLQESLRRCAKAQGWKDLESYFAVVPLHLGGERPAFLVYPAEYCMAMHGAHSIPFWIVEQTGAASYRELLAGVDDTVQVLDSRSEGYRDIAVIYGFDAPRVYRYDGTDYDGGGRRPSGNRKPRQ